MASCPAHERAPEATLLVAGSRSSSRTRIPGQSRSRRWNVPRTRRFGLPGPGRWSRTDLLRAASRSRYRTPPLHDTMTGIAWCRGGQCPRCRGTASRRLSTTPRSRPVTTRGRLVLCRTVDNSSTRWTAQRLRSGSGSRWPARTTHAAPEHVEDLVGDTFAIAGRGRPGQATVHVVLHDEHRHRVDRGTQRCRLLHDVEAGLVPLDHACDAAHLALHARQAPQDLGAVTGIRSGLPGALPTAGCAAWHGRRVIASSLVRSLAYWEGV